jgi:hypothetical protein
MADVRCQMCGKPNPPELEECQFCGARIKPVLASTPADSRPIEAGEEPISKDASEFEKVKPAEEGSISSAENESPAEPSSDESLHLPSAATPGSDSSKGVPDELSGLGEAASEDGEAPDWLASLRSDKPVEPEPVSSVEEEATTELGDEDWIARLGGEMKAVTPEPPAGGRSAVEALPESASEGGLPDRLQSLQPSESGVQELPAASPAISAERETGGPVPAEDLPDWLNQLEETAAEPEPTPPVGGAESVPDWLSNLRPESGTLAALFGGEPQAESSSSGETPDQLSPLQADVNAAEAVEKHKDDFGVVSEPAAQTQETGPLPEWLAGIDRTAPPSGGTPALIDIDDEGNPPGEKGETAFSLEAPDWLFKLDPEQGAEKGTEKEEDQLVPGDLESAELPSWVQAMRPLESVVAEAMTAPQEDARVTEQSGPLAGLRGVLPSGPGLGPLRKPPAYSVKLRVSDGQQRYAAYLDRLVTGETKPRAVGTKRLTSNRLWRWLIALLLILAVGVPLFRGVQVAPETSSLSSDKGAAFTLIGGLPADTPVLIVFDYDPALSGELEATAAPFIGKLLRKGTPLAFISTSPTGPALAERFMQTTPLVSSHQYRRGEQYVNLGYLAGGPAGMLYFAGDPTAAMPTTVDGKPAWETGPLQGIQGLSNFAAFILLTDNADTGRNWIEQVGPRLGNTPMIMIISTQAEPLVRPYFDSGQLKGLVSGLADAKIYEQSDNRPGLAHLYWSSFSIGTLVAVLLIVIGAIWSAVTGWRARRRNPGEEA